MEKCLPFVVPAGFSTGRSILEVEVFSGFKGEVIGAVTVVMVVAVVVVVVVGDPFN